jgi:hemoglobin
MSGSTFERYGGFRAVSRIVMTFYDLVLDSDIVGHHFENVDMAKQIDHQTRFVSGVMGGPKSISDDRLKAVHSHIRVTNTEFDEIISLFGQALKAHDVGSRDITAICDVMESKRSLIVNDT